MCKPYTTVALSLTLVAGLFFSACSNPSDQTSAPLSLSSTSTTASQTESTTQQLVDTNQGKAMKTLADFEQIAATQVTLYTTKGEITFEVYPDKVPLTVQNFLNLAQDGFYDGIVFHRVIADFMAQAGDPQTKQPGTEAMWGSGGPGYEIADEFDETLKHDGPGIVSMANRGPNTGGSQFFITYGATPWLDGKHAVFGKVTTGIDVLEQITEGDVIEKVTLE